MKKTQNNNGLYLFCSTNIIKLIVITLFMLLSLSLFASTDDILWTNNSAAVSFRVNKESLESILIDGKVTTYGKIIQKGSNVGFGNYVFYDSESEKNIENPEALLNRRGG